MHLSQRPESSVAFEGRARFGSRGIVWAVGAFLLLGTLCLNAADFGKIVLFEKGTAIPYPKFSITYLGERKVSSPVFKPGFTYYDFELSGKAGKKTISWSSGTGLIDAADFEYGGKAYCLELRGSVSFKGWMKDTEMIVWTQGDWLNASRRKR